ncbi:MAG: shikimate kinase [Candidatus Lokiarchaeota archaeon]|nr:shikimate kinase [Candidatus Lokiarchaeota archaeon]
MLKSSVALIGFMGTGKTTVGRLLVKKLEGEYQFIEMDQLIEEMAGKPIPEIFSQDGEEVFRDHEIKACQKVSTLKKVVISCGGGAVLNKKNVENLKKNSTIILLESTIETILERILKDGVQLRPVIDKEDPIKEVKKLFYLRNPQYKSVTDIIIDTENKDESVIVDEIIQKLKIEKD